jgi:hypothetical protein
MLMPNIGGEFDFDVAPVCLLMQWSTKTPLRGAEPKGLSPEGPSAACGVICSLLSVPSVQWSR